MRNYEVLTEVAKTAANRYASPEQRVFRILDLIKKERPELLEEKPANPQQEAGIDY